MTLTLLRQKALFGEPVPSEANRRGSLLWQCRRLRALRSWIRPGAYAELRLSDDLKGVQRRLVWLRKERSK